jgi:hypothetical protein
MTTVVINDRTKEGKALIELIKHLKHATIIDEKTPNSSLMKSIEDAESGKVNEYNSTEELFAKLRKKSTAKGPSL